MFTTQAVVALEYLHQTRNVRGPFLVIAPLSTLTHWQREVEAWTTMYPVVYHGSELDRQVRKIQKSSNLSESTVPFLLNAVLKCTVHHLS